MTWSRLTNGTVSPYLHWFAEYEDLPKAPTDDRRSLPFEASPFVFTNLRGREFDVSEILDELDGTDATLESGSRDMSVVPMPSHMRNGDWGAPTEADTWPQTKDWGDEPPSMDGIEALVGIIDTGIALGHRRLRRKDHRSRVLAHWQQGADWRTRRQSWLPFGREVYQAEVNSARSANSNGRALDEEAFNRSLGVTERHLFHGHRELDRRAAHGTHMLDLAAGAEPGEPFAENVGVLSVSMPPHVLHGTAGDFLQFYANAAVNRLVALRKALLPYDPQSCPLFINFSYGMIAGPKDRALPLESTMVNLSHNSNVHFFLPAGNGNLARQVARYELIGSDAANDIPWRLPPGDDTSNHLEIWIDLDIEPGALNAGDLAIMVRHNGDPDADGISIPVLPDNAYLTHRLPEGGRIYGRRFTASTPDKTRIGLHVALPATLRYDTRRPDVRGGLWHVRLSSAHEGRMDVIVQSDQSRRQGSRNMRQTYLDDPNYVRYTPDGFLADTCPYGHVRSIPDKGQYVTRIGTVNALATTLPAIGAHTARGGRPALYSASGALGYGGRSQIAKSYPAEDSVHLFGVLAAGARDGSTVALRGTSAACAMATRAAVAGAIRAHVPGPVPFGDAACNLKVGAGREARADEPLVARNPVY